ncbi:MAG TPA: PIN domain-containing protein [Planctomycetota bacterium]|nr:PIN domain-containing protein [Planctomycetota bacterium]
MGYLIDSSVLAQLERRGEAVAVLVPELGDEEIVISTVVASEMLVGVHLAEDAEVRARRELFLESVLDTIAVVPFDLPIARMHARLGAQLRKAGTPIGAHDLLIGATALAIGFGVYTSDARSFPKIPGLRVKLRGRGGNGTAPAPRKKR